MTPLICRQPCQRCDHLRTVHDAPPYDICLASPTHDFECDILAATERIADRVAQVAALIAKEPEKRLRAEEAMQVADAYSNVLYDLGAELDEGAFLAACNAATGCVRCQRRTPVDDNEYMCRGCSVVVAA